MPRNSKTTCQVDDTGVQEYCTEVLSGNIPVGEFVALACEEHERALVDGHKRGLVWSNERAVHVMRFFETFLTLSEEADGEAFKLELWQKFIIGSVRGWYQNLKSGRKLLRFRVCYTEIGKGNGKTPLMAGLSNYNLLASGTSQPEIYLAATALDQAKIPFADCVHQVDWLISKHPEWKRRLEVQAESIRCKTQKGGFIRPVSSQFRQLSGQRVHFAGVDELHEHPDDLVLGRLRRGTKGRREAQIFMITNSGDDETSTCGQNRNAVIENLRNGSPNPNLFGYVCTLDKDEDPFLDKTCWIKTNPNLGVSVYEDYIDELVTSAKGIPKEEADVRRFSFCQWVGAENPAFDMSRWDPGQSEETIDDQPKGADCYLGLDVAAKLDILALVALFQTEIEDEHTDEGILWKRGWKAFGWFYIPEQSVSKFRKMQTIEFQKWIDDGRITVTPGVRTDHSYMIAQVKKLYRRFNVVRMGFDPHNIGNTDNNIKKWIESQEPENDPEEMLVEITQSISSLNWATKELQAAIKESAFDTGGCPVLRWMAANSVLREDENKNCMVSKKNSKGKIDGIAAIVCAMTASIAEIDEMDEDGDDEGVDEPFVIDIEEPEWD